MALTFVRTSELIGASGQSSTWKPPRWNIPAKRMQMPTPHIVPLARQTLELLDVLSGITGSSDGPLPETGPPASR